MNKYENHIKGALIGGWCGDASGATLEFCKCKITEEMVNNALQMNGGGIFNLGSGQVTDDSELELAMIHGMLKSENKDYFPYNEICEEYIEWIKSNPFDVGRTCANAFATSTDLESMLKNTESLNNESESNGALMRAVPLAIWGLNLSEEDLMKIACLDARLSHPNQICQLINAIYVLIIRHLILHPNDKDGALFIIIKYVNHRILREWYLDARLFNTKNNKINPRENIGHIKHAFQLMVYFLQEKRVFSSDINGVTYEYLDYSYEEAIKFVLSLGGDTDTNAKIIGSLIGALKGYDNIPHYMKEKVLHFNNENGIIRPEKYLIKNIYEKIDLLYY